MESFIRSQDALRLQQCVNAFGKFALKCAVDEVLAGMPQEGRTGSSRREWLSRLPVSITPREFSNLVHARTICRSPPDDQTHLTASTLHRHLRPDHHLSGSSHFSDWQYLKAFKSLVLTPKPSPDWLGSRWQRHLAAELLSHTAKSVRESEETAPIELPRPFKNAQGGLTHLREADLCPTDAFLLHLQARRRDELRKSREKQEEKQRSLQEKAKKNSQVCFVLIRSHMCFNI